MSRRLFVPVLLAAALAHAAAGAAQTPLANSTGLTAFGSDKEFSDYVRRLTASAERTRCLGSASISTSFGGTPSESTTMANSSEPGTITGRVIGGTGVPLGSALVFVDGMNIGTLSTEGGLYTLMVPHGRLKTRDSITVTSRLIGYGARSVTVPLRAGQLITVNFRLCDTPLKLGEVVVTGAGSDQVTNTQEGGVDEGDIVKLHGDYLVILRRGRLFTVSLRHGRLDPVSAVDAFGPGINPQGTWYDELILYRDRVVVVGYSYARGGTELGVFQLDSAGGLHYRATYQLRSNDYYSSRNYASRLIGGKLVFYSPLYVAWSNENPLAALPAMRRWRPAPDSARFERISMAQHIYRPAREWGPLDGVALHSITACDLTLAELQCEATVVVGPPSDVFYVSPVAVYVWAGPYRRCCDSAIGHTPDSASSILFRLPLDGSAPGALGVSGSPVDQFSFLDSGDGYVNVLVRSSAAGDAMWAAERTGGSAALLRVPVASFGDGAQAAPVWRYRPLPVAAGPTFQNRFVGSYLLYGTGNGWRAPTDRRTTIFLIPWRGGDVEQIELEHGVDRIEALGRDAVVVGADTKNLYLTGIRLSGTPRAVQRFTLTNAAQGELRSHGFFYRVDDEGTGVIGLPVRGGGEPGFHHLIFGSAGVLFLRTDPLGFNDLGQLTARTESEPRDACQASCVDWYGNARPLFVHGRVFALLGYELVEGRIVDGRIEQLRRLDFASTARPETGE